MEQAKVYQPQQNSQRLRLCLSAFSLGAFVRAVDSKADVPSKTLTERDVLVGKKSRLIVLVHHFRHTLAGTCLGENGHTKHCFGFIARALVRGYVESLVLVRIIDAQHRFALEACAGKASTHGNLDSIFNPVRKPLVQEIFLLRRRGEAKAVFRKSASDVSKDCKVNE